MQNFGLPLEDFLDSNEIASVAVLKSSLGLDATRSFQFWEAVVARILGGSLTAHKTSWDVTLSYGSTAVFVEVKYAREIGCRFATGSRPVFKFALPKGGGRVKSAHVVTLVGIEPAGLVHTWAVPAGLLKQSKSITLTSPRFRIGRDRSRGVGGYYCPPDQLLPEVLRSYRCHLAYDKSEHAATRARTRLAEQTTGMEPLFVFDLEGLTA